jgi:hypothetical protein
LPAFLGYSNNLEEDKKHLLKHISNLEKPTLRNAILAFLLKSEHCNPEEKAELERMKKSFVD